LSRPERDFSIRNHGRLPVNFKWVIQHNQSESLHVSPGEGVILPNESANQRWTFSPDNLGNKAEAL
jgi:hypothetical protein